MSNKEIEERLRNLKGGRDEELIRQHREAGISMFGSHPAFPGELIELTPEGKYFAGKLVEGKWQRIREITEEYLKIDKK